MAVCCTLFFAFWDGLFRYLFQNINALRKFFRSFNCRFGNAKFISNGLGCAFAFSFRCRKNDWFILNHLFFGVFVFYLRSNRLLPCRLHLSNQSQPLLICHRCEICPHVLSRCTLTAGRKQNPQKVESTPPLFLMGGNISATIYFFAVFASFNAL